MPMASTRVKSVRGRERNVELAPDYTAMSSDELDQIIDELTKQEARISYARTIIQARLDLLIDEREGRRGVARLCPSSAID